MSRYVLIVVVTLSLFACDRENSRNRDAAQNSPARPAGSTQTPSAGATDNRRTMNPVAPPQQDLPGNRIAGSTSPQQRVELTEYDIRMPDTFQRGEFEFFIVNSGKENHSFIIEGDGMHLALPQPLTRGNSATLQLGLDPGTYTVYCPVDGHRGKGMQRTITVR